MLAGIALFAFDSYLLYQSATGGGIPAETELIKITGEVVQTIMANAGVIGMRYGATRANHNA